MMMKPNKNPKSHHYVESDLPYLEEVYKISSEFEGRIKKGALGDTIYMGIFAKTLVQEWGFTKSFLTSAEKAGILYKKHFAPAGKRGTYRIGYLLMTKKLNQRTKFKRFIKRVWKLFKP